MAGFTRSLGQKTRVQAKLAALREGLNLALCRGLVPLDVEIDSQIATDIVLNDYIPIDHPLASLVFYCKQLLVQYPRTNLRHIFREANLSADILAKNGGQALSSSPFLFMRVHLPL
ncbi:hypothetical protein M9H77_18381 [Catharanthus roseus]|uniref:Uncharacterized protein n=1 Tax=Catharanthus roseus TaxID=4058 RepID=A0ACC0B7M0_CATRO|nr:hypothetical protein M9H77_18381 [Catharanthus roseus]